MLMVVEKNLSDLFTKEEKDISHFLTIRNLVLQSKRDIKLGLVSCGSISTPIARRSLGPEGFIEGGVKLGNETLSPSDLVSPVK